MCVLADNAAQDRLVNNIYSIINLMFDLEHLFIIIGYLTNDETQTKTQGSFPERDAEFPQNIINNHHLSFSEQSGMPTLPLCESEASSSQDLTLWWRVLVGCWRASI